MSSAANRDRPRSDGFRLLSAGCLLLSLGFWGLWQDIEWIAQPFYAYAWWGYILVLDGSCVLRRGHSLLTTRSRFLLPLWLGSTTFWFFFELLNAHFQNWYYVGVYRLNSTVELLLATPFTAICFATVFIGIFETHETLTAFGLWRRWQGKPGRLPLWATYAVQVLGLIMATLAIGFPKYLSPLIWGSLTFLVDPWNYRRGARSILRDLEQRDWGLVMRMFVAGLLCGVVWESLNFFAPQKWIYTVRGLEGLKIFEMPLLGFLGFPALAFDSLAAFSLLAWLFLGNETWEHPGDLRYWLKPRPRPTRLTFIRTVPLQLAFWFLVITVILGTNFGSVQLIIEDLRLTPKEVHTLRESSIQRPRHLLHLQRDPKRRAATQTMLGWDDDKFRVISDQAELYTFKGIGHQFGGLLEAIGIKRVRDLAEWRPIDLHSQLVEKARDGDAGAPRLDMVRVWVLAARNRGIVLYAAND